MKPLLAALLLATTTGLSTAAAPAVGSVSTSRSFAVANNTGNLSNTYTGDYDGSILVIMFMTPWCPNCQSNAQAVGSGLASFFAASSRGNLKDKNDRGVPMRTLLLSTEEAAEWDDVNDSFASTNGYQKWGIDANANRTNPRLSLGYYRGGFINSANLYDWGNDRRRLVILNLVRGSASHSYREIVLNQNAYSSSDNTAARAAINAVRPEPATVAPAITTQPASVTINNGTTTRLTAAASGTTPTYQWYIGNAGVTTSPVSGATYASYTTPALTTSTRYWVRASNSAGNANSTAALVTVTPPTVAPAIISHPASVTINSGASTLLTATASGTSPTFQWYVGTSGVTTQPVSGATSASFATPALIASTSYWVRASNASGFASSSAALVAVTPPPVIKNFSTWQAARIFPAGQSGPNTDPDFDGLANLVEFFHGTDPLVPESGDPPFRLIRESGGTRLIYQQAMDLVGITATYQSSPTLAHWALVPAAGLVTTIRATGATQEITVHMPASSDPARFYQIKIVAN